MAHYCCNQAAVPDPYSNGYSCLKCGTYYSFTGFDTPAPHAPAAKRSVWYRNRTVSYTREMNVSDLNEDGTVKGEEAWWEEWK